VYKVQKIVKKTAIEIVKFEISSEEIEEVSSPFVVSFLDMGRIVIAGVVVDVLRVADEAVESALEGVNVEDVALGIIDGARLGTALGRIVRCGNGPFSIRHGWHVDRYSFHPFRDDPNYVVPSIRF